MVKEKTQKRKVTSAVTAVVAAAVILLTGTFAWQSISQTALNETTVTYVNPGGRLHDDFNGSNKDVYVENFSSYDTGSVPIFDRVRLDEYMEIGKGAGLKAGGTGTNEATPVVAGTDINDVSTWTAHIPGTSVTEGAEGDFHTYWTWTMGGETVFLPTFNKNKDSLEADINGTFAGPDGDPATKEDRYGDYETYTAGQQITAGATYDADDNDIDEGGNGVENVNYTVNSETHTAKATQTATVLTMAEWKAQGAPVGPYWVYDTDGWAYWAQPILPGEATGLLLDGIELNEVIQDDWYYGINVVGQFSDGGDWGQAEGNGFYTDAASVPSADALELLNKALAEKIAVTVSSADGVTTVASGSTLQFSAAVTLAGETIANQNVSWTVSGNTSEDTTVNTDGLLTVGGDEAAGTLIITATSKENIRVSGNMEITVNG